MKPTKMDTGAILARTDSVLLKADIRTSSFTVIQMFEDAIGPMRKISMHVTEFNPNTQEFKLQFYNEEHAREALTLREKLIEQKK